MLIIRAICSLNFKAQYLRCCLCTTTTENRFGIWNDDGKGTLTVSFPDANHEPLPQSHMRAEQNVLTFNGVQSSGFVLRLDSPDGHVYTYRLVKW